MPRTREKRPWKANLFDEIDLDRSVMTFRDPWNQGFVLEVRSERSDKVQEWDKKHLARGAATPVQKATLQAFATLAQQGKRIDPDKSSEDPEFLALVKDNLEQPETTEPLLALRRKRCLKVLVVKLTREVDGKVHVLNASDRRWILSSQPDLMPSEFPYGGQSVSAAFVAWIEGCSRTRERVVSKVQTEQKKKYSATEGSPPDTSRKSHGPKGGRSTTASN